jgi:hypothetical protein
VRGTESLDTKATIRAGDETSIHRLEGRTMSRAIDNLQAAQARAMQIRPKVGGFPYLAETLRRAGVRPNTGVLPSCRIIYLTQDGPVVRNTTHERTADVRYYGCLGEEYLEDCPAVDASA